jgi:hypothetical protein
MLAFVRFGNDGGIMEDFCCCCKELPETTKSQDIFNILSYHLEFCGPSRNQLVGICTDGAPSTVGPIGSLVTLVKVKITMS